MEMLVFTWLLLTAATTAIMGTIVWGFRVGADSDLGVDDRVSTYVYTAVLAGAFWALICFFNPDIVPEQFIEKPVAAVVEQTTTTVQTEIIQ